MNKQRRKRIYKIVDMLNDMLNQTNRGCDETDIENILDDIQFDVEDILSEEEDYRDNMPENLQNSIRYEVAEEACDNLTDAVDNINYALENVDNKDALVEHIQEAIKCLNSASM